MRTDQGSSDILPSGHHSYGNTHVPGGEPPPSTLQYHPVSVMYGAAKDEGSFVYGTLHNEWMMKNNLTMVRPVAMGGP